MKPSEVKEWHNAQIKAIAHLPKALKNDALKKIEATAQRMLDEATAEQPTKKEKEVKK